MNNFEFLVRKSGDIYEVYNTAMGFWLKINSESEFYQRVMNILCKYYNYEELPESYDWVIVGYFVNDKPVHAIVIESGDTVLKTIIDLYRLYPALIKTAAEKYLRKHFFNIHN